jgi:hypothetical protein
MFLQTLLTTVQSWIQSLPAETCAIQLLDRITGLLVFLGTALNNTCTGQPQPNPLGANASNPLINFWHNVRDGLLIQTQLIQSLVDQGYITHAELTAFKNSVTNAFNLTIPPQPSAQNSVTTLKILLGALSACHLQKDARYQWALLFLLAFAINPTQPCNIADLDALYCFLFNHGFKPAKVSNLDDPTIVRLLPGQTTAPSNPCTSIKSSDHKPCKPNFCETDIAWLSNYTSGTQEKICKRTEKDKPCVFPKATRLILNFLAQDAKQIIQDRCHNLDWCQLRCILKKMLVVAMFTGQNESQQMCGNNNDGGEKW